MDDVLTANVAALASAGAISLERVAQDGMRVRADAGAASFRRQASPCRIEPLGKQHDRSAFQCGAEALDRYLKQQARQDAEKYVAAPFVLLALPEPGVLGYYTLSAGVVDVSDITRELPKSLPRNPQLPVTLIGRLAVDRSLRGQGRGSSC
jgi:hypothetical protein